MNPQQGTCRVYSLHSNSYRIVQLRQLASITKYFCAIWFKESDICIYDIVMYYKLRECMQAVPGIGWGKHTRVILDVGCGVASFGGFLFEKDVLAMSFAPKDEHEAQVQFALERGIPAISAVMGSQRLPFPSRVFDLLHCARCRVPWHAEGQCS